MNPIGSGSTTECLEGMTKLVVSAEWELKAFARAVHKSFGPEEALKSINDWLAELESMTWSEGESPDWRRVTVAASAKLAQRISTTSLECYEKAG